MGTYELYKAINQSTIELLQDLNPISEPEVSKPTLHVRLEEKSFMLTEDMKRAAEPVTGHYLNEYKNKFRSIKLEESSDIWIDKLLAIHREELNDF